MVYGQQIKHNTLDLCHAMGPDESLGEQTTAWVTMMTKHIKSTKYHFL